MPTEQDNNTALDTATEDVAGSVPDSHFEASAAPADTPVDDVQQKMLAAFDAMTEEDDDTGAPATPSATKTAGDVDPDQTQALTGRETPEPDNQSEGQQPDKASPEDLERAREAMQRVLGKEAMEDLKLTDEQILERGAPLAKQQADQQKVYNEKKQLEEQVDQIVQQRVQEILQKQQADPSKPDDQAKPPSSDLAQLVDESLKEVFDDTDAYLDEDVSTAMRKAMGKVAATLNETFEKRLGSVSEQQAQTMNELNLQKDRLEMRQISLDPSFQKEFPDVRNPDQFERVASTVYRLAQTDQDRKDYFDEAGNPRWDRLMRDAAALVTTRNNTTKQAQVDIARSGRDASSSQPLGGTSHGQPSQPAMTEEARRQAMMQIMDEMGED